MMRTSAIGNRNTVERVRFTLAEIIVVLFIIGLVSALVLPRVVKAPAGIAVRNARVQMAKPLREAALRARANGRDVRATLNPREREFLITPSEKDAAGTPVPDAVSLPRKLGAEDENAEWIFFADGGAAGPDLRFTCRNRDFTLSVDKLTGTVKTTEMTDDQGLQHSGLNP